MYEYSIPLPMNYNKIDELINLNNTLKKGKITTFYSCQPSNAYDKPGFEQTRTIYPNITSFDEFIKYPKYVIDKGFDFVYLLNSPRIDNKQRFDLKTKKLNLYLKKLKENGINKVRVTNVQLLDYIHNNHSDIEIFLSTSQEFYSVKQYENLLKKYPNIKQIVLSYEVNRDFDFIKNLKKITNIPIEIMVNEGCLPGCPYRYEHNLSLDEKFTKIVDTNREEYCNNIICHKQFYENQWENIIKANVVYPWDLDKYNLETGITNFKLVGRNADDVDEIEKTHATWLKSVDDFDFALNSKFKNFNFYICATEFDFLLSDVIKYLPPIEYFIKNGKNCKDLCNVKCKLCYKLANEANIFLGDKKE